MAGSSAKGQPETQRPDAEQIQAEAVALARALDELGLTCCFGIMATTSEDDPSRKAKGLGRHAMASTFNLASQAIVLFAKSLFTKGNAKAYLDKATNNLILQQGERALSFIESKSVGIENESGLITSALKTAEGVKFLETRHLDKIAALVRRSLG